MKIDLNSIDLNQFNVKEGLIGGEVCFLVFPKQLNTEWTRENKIFRSSIWNSKGELVSASFPKFTNWGERPEVFPVPTSLKGTTAVTKIDGSALIVSRYKGNTIIRTRGTFDASGLENGHEIEILKLKYSSIFDFGNDQTVNRSYIYEWVSPTNKIVLDYGDEPRLFLIGIVRHEDYSLLDQKNLDDTCKWLSLERPETHTFNDIVDMIDTVKKWQGLEGICLYSNNDQTIHKIKADNYLLLHHFKGNATLENTVDLFFEFGCPDFKTFQAKLIKKFDWECANLVLGFCSNICDGWKEVIKIEQGMKYYIESQLLGLQRKDQALKILSSYGNTNRSGFVFTLLDGKELGKDQYKKLMWQVLKK